MKIQQIIARAKELATKRAELYQDKRYLKVMGLFCGKGLLIVEGIKPTPKAKVSIQDVLWVADKIEPRIIEVLPAALLHFPKNFLAQKFLPKELREIVKKIEEGESGSDYMGIPFQQYLKWAEIPLPDGRVRPLSSKRVSRSFRLTRVAAKLLREKASKMQTSESNYLNEMILNSK